MLHLMSSYTCPSNERSPEVLATAYMTATLSPFIIISVKLDSTANSRAFWHANTSASSLQLMEGPLIDIAAITSPVEFWIITPNPDLWIPANTAALKLSLYNGEGGGFHLCPVYGAVCGILIWVWTFLYSSKYSNALWFSHFGSLICPPCIIAFLWFQINQAWTRNASISAAENLSKSYSNKAILSGKSVVHFCNLIAQPAHTSYATPHSQIACITDSGNPMQHWHPVSVIIFRRTRFTRPGRVSWQAFHPNLLILLATCSCQIFFHICWTPTPSEPATPSSFLITFLARWYPDLTEYFRFLVCIYTIESNMFLQLNGILQIEATSSAQNFP